MLQSNISFAQAIAALGTTPESISEVLRSKNIKGYSNWSSGCPIAVYLRSFGFHNITVTANTVYHSEEFVHCCAGLKQWIADFDSGKYSEFSIPYPEDHFRHKKG